MTTISDPNGRWWAALDNGDVWPCTVESMHVFGVTVRLTCGIDRRMESIVGETYVLDRKRVYDNSFNHPSISSCPPSTTT